MALIDPNKPQSTDEQLTNELISDLRVRGPFGRLDVGDVVLPIYALDLSDRVRSAVAGYPVIGRTISVSSLTVGPSAANITVTDTGQLAAGTYDLLIRLMIVQDGLGIVNGLIQHRDAANGASINDWHFSGGFDTSWWMGITILQNERVRVRLTAAQVLGQEIASSLSLHLRAS